MSAAPSFSVGMSTKATPEQIDQVDAKLDETFNNFMGFLPALYTQGFVRGADRRRTLQDVPFGGGWAWIKYLLQREAYRSLDRSLKEKEKAPAHMCNSKGCSNFVEKPLRGPPSPFCPACRQKIRAGQEHERYLERSKVVAGRHRPNRRSRRVQRPKAPLGTRI